MQDANEILPLSLNAMLGIIVLSFVLFQAFKGMKGNIPGNKKIFFGVIFAFVFNLLTNLFMAFYSYIFPYNMKEIIEIVITFVYFIFIIIAAWGFKEFVNYSVEKENEIK